MIQITFTLSIKSGNPATDIEPIVEQGTIEIYDVMYAGLKQSIEDNVILNSYVIINENNQVIVSHFATSPENAQLFLSHYVDTVEFWAKYGIDWRLEQEEIDFGTVDPDTLIPLIVGNVMYEIPLNL
jgi:UPF0288 family protein (methanogenesis marker protein 3)